MRPAGAGPLGLPLPLPPSEAALIRDIFARQRHGDLKGAEAETAKLTDQTLLGHILADRIMARPTRTPLPVMADWLHRYSTLPDAAAIRAALVKRAPAGAQIPAIQATAHPWCPPRMAGKTSSTRHRRGAPSPLAGDAAAERLGRAAWMKSGRRDGAAAYVAGLACWRQGSFAEAASLFEAASTAADAGAGLRAAGAFWAARALERDGQSRRLAALDAPRRRRTGTCCTACSPAACSACPSLPPKSAAC